MSSLLALLLAAALPGHAAAKRPPYSASKDSGTAFIVLAPDRGFLGNEELRDLFAGYGEGFNAALAIVGEGDVSEPLERALGSVSRRGTREVVVLPLFSSARHPLLLEAARELSSRAGKLDAYLSPPFFASPLAREALAERAGHLSRDPAKEHLILAAHGPDDPAAAAAIERDLAEAAQGLLPRLPFADVDAVALRGASPADGGLHWRHLPSRWKALSEKLRAARAAGRTPVLIPFDFGVKLDSGMSLGALLKPLADAHGALYDGRDVTPHPAAVLWLARESAARLPADASDLGVVVMAHGATGRWNRTFLAGLQGLARRRLLEPAFGMGDRAVLERALTRLAARGARRAAIVRVFSLESSFLAPIEQALGLARPGSLSPSRHHRHGHGGHAGHGASSEGAIATALPAVTVGGLEDSPLFARALADRALALSRDPTRETVFLLGHGSGDDAEDARWNRNLASLAGQVRRLAAERGKAFRAVEYDTWREDWPEKRAVSVPRIREAVARAASSGRAIVVPARTHVGGPEPELLKGVDFAYDGLGFSGHPAFEEWVEARVEEALELFRSERLAGLTPLSAGRPGPGSGRSSR